MHLPKPRLPLLYALALAAIALPIVVTLKLANYQSLQRQQERAATLAADILQRSERVSEQLQLVFDTLKSTRFDTPCSPAAQDLMRSLVIRANMLIDVGYVQGDQLLCSAFGDRPYPVGPVSYTSSSGYHIRTGVQHPLAPGTRLVISTDPHGGYAGLVHESAAIDNLPADPRLSVGLVGLGQHSPMLQHGEFKPGWLRSLDSSPRLTFYDGDHIVAWQRSERFAYAAFAALPRSSLDEDWQHTLFILLPIGMAAGLLLALALSFIVRQRTTIPALLRGGLKRGEFFLVYQPIVDLASGRWVGAEALLRWRRADGELVRPDLFIPIAEQHQLIEQITQEVLRLIARDAAALLRRHPDFHIALNLSAADFLNPTLAARLSATVQQMGVQPANLHVEATERVFLNAEATQQVLSELRERGFVVAIDDFGTGYSSLSYLTGLHMDALKIDKAFVDTIGIDAITRSVIDHIIALAHSLGLKMVAEGVETQAQADYLRAQGVQFGQGWLYAKPLPIEDLGQRLDAAAQR